MAEPVLGTAQLGGGYGVARDRSRPVDAGAILCAAFEQGIRWLDTAPGYGEAEALIGAFVERHGRPDGLRLCTKLPGLPPDLPAADLERAVAEAVSRSRNALRADTLDAYLVHAPADLERYGRALVDALLRCRELGWIGRIGVSVYEPEEADAALRFPELSVIQLPFHLLDRRLRTSGAVDRLRRAGYWTFARSALLQGLLTLSPRALAAVPAGPWLAALRELLSDFGLDPVAAALAYAAAESGADHVVVGVDGQEQLASTLAALRRPLPPGFAEAVEARLLDVPPRVRDPRRWTEAP